MISREDMLFSIGYDGNAALVDRSARTKFGKYSTAQLIDAGLFRAATASAIFSGSQDELAQVASAYNRCAKANYPVEAIPRLFGVAKVTASKILAL